MVILFFKNVFVLRNITYWNIQIFVQILLLYVSLDENKKEAII